MVQSLGPGWRFCCQNPKSHRIPHSKSPPPTKIETSHGGLRDFSSELTKNIPPLELLMEDCVGDSWRKYLVLAQLWLTETFIFSILYENPILVEIIFAVGAISKYLYIQNRCTLFENRSTSESVSIYLEWDSLTYRIDPHFWTKPSLFSKKLYNTCFHDPQDPQWNILHVEQLLIQLTPTFPSMPKPMWGFPSFLFLYFTFSNFKFWTQHHT